MKRTLITTYIDPDLDGTACGFAYLEFLKKSGYNNLFLSFIGSYHEETEFVFRKFGIIPPAIIKDFKPFDSIILVDASDASVFGELLDCSKVIEIIDHRSVNEKEKFSKAKIQIEMVGSAATLITEKFINSNIQISFESAVLLYSAIVSNTLNFRASVTTERDKQAASWLLHKVKLPDNYWEILFLSKSDVSLDKLTQKINHDYAIIIIKTEKIGVGQLEIMDGGKLVKERFGEIKDIMLKIKTENNLKYVFINIIDLRDLCGYILAFDDITKVLIEKALRMKFVENTLILEKALMRKEIMPRIKESLT